MSITQNLLSIKETLPEEVRLVAVSKTMPVDALREAYEAGQRHFGENKVQELTAKQAELPNDICWHLIGHLQTNKVKYIVPFVEYIESVDSLKLLREINKEASKVKRTVKCLLQIHIAEEETKFGLNEEELTELVQTVLAGHFENVVICGLMGMATFTEDEKQIRKEFKSLRRIFDKLKSSYFIDKEYFRELSMGMSGDYQIAVEEGSTNVRIGSSIFGVRIYH